MKQRNGLNYCVSFDTKEIPGKIACVRVSLDKIFIGMNDSVRIDLVDHPLYGHLERYVKDNPSNGKKKPA